MRSIISLSLVTTAVWLTAPRVAHAQSEGVALEVVDQTAGVVGHRLVALVREGYQARGVVRLTTEGPRWVVRVSAIPKDPDRPTVATVYAVVWLARGVRGCAPNADTYLDSTVGYAGAERVHEVATDVVHETERLLAENAALRLEER